MYARDRAIQKVTACRKAARAIMASALLVLFVDALAFQNEPTEFHGIKWGEDFAVHSNEMILVAKDTINGFATTTWYRRKGDKMFFGDARLTEILYGYSVDKLVRVNIKTFGAVNRKALTRALLSQFGTPDHKSTSRNSSDVWGKQGYLSSEGVTVVGTNTGIMSDCDDERDPMTPVSKNDCAVLFMAYKIMEELKPEEDRRYKEYQARIAATPCPTVEQIKAKSEGRYIKVVKGDLPRFQYWHATQIVDGWVIYADTGKHDFIPSLNRVPKDTFLIAVRQSTMKGTSRRDSALVARAKYLGQLDEIQTKDRDGFPVLVKRFEAIYMEGCK